MEAGRDFTPTSGVLDRMPIYEIRFCDDRPPEVVLADEMRRENVSIVFRSVELVILTPRWVVQRRRASSEVAAIRRLDRPDPTMVSPEGYRVERILL